MCTFKAAPQNSYRSTKTIAAPHSHIATLFHTQSIQPLAAHILHVSQYTFARSSPANKHRAEDAEDFVCTVTNSWELQLACLFVERIYFVTF